MKIKSLVVENVASYRDCTTFAFDDTMNILIGPNGGGKTNLQRIVALTISKFFIHQYQFVRDDNNVRIERHDPWNERVLKRAFPPYLGNSAADQLIQIELVPEKRDVQNIEAIGGNLSQFNEQLSYWEKKYEVYEPLPFAKAISESISFTYTIRNLQLEPSGKDTAQGAFAEYLREFFIFLRVAHRVPDVTLSSPVFFFSSERTLSRQFEVQAAQLSEQAYFDGYRSAYQAAVGENMNLMQWGAQHFVRLYRRAVTAAAKVKDKIWSDFFYQYDDVKLLTHYLEQLGYTWNFATDTDQLSFSFLLTKDGEQRSTDMFSSGEREIVHFLLAMFALNVRDGLVLVDEPELHLHPRWQRIFLGLFRDVSVDRNNQFVVTTHSPVFVTPETIDSVTRIYRTPGKGSSRVALRNVELPEKKNLVRMINSQNNERLFFADKVVLVEGITDRLLMESLLDRVGTKFNHSAAIEVIEVGGKHNLEDYAIVLEGLLTPVFTVADRDYLTTVGSQQTRALFHVDYDKQWEVLTKDKKSSDRKYLLTLLTSAVQSVDMVELKKFLGYFGARLQKLKKPLTAVENQVLEDDYARLRKKGIFLLRRGEIEDYLPSGSKDLRGIVEFVSNSGWINQLEEAEARTELGEIASAVLGIGSNEHELLMKELADGRFSIVESAVKDTQGSEAPSGHP